MMAHIRLAQERRLKQEEDNPQALDPPNPARVEKRPENKNARRQATRTRKLRRGLFWPGQTCG